MNMFSPDSTFGKFFSWVADILILNALWLLCSLPIFTMGASTTALYYALMKKQERDESYIYKNFFNSFKSNFKQSTIIWLIMLLLGTVLIADLRIGTLFYANGNAMGKMFMFSSTVLLIPYLLILIYIFPVQAKFENKIKDNMKNALLMAIGHLGHTALIIVIIACFVLLPFISRSFLVVEILCGFSLLGFLTSIIFIKVFKKHLPKEEDPEVTDQNKIK